MGIVITCLCRKSKSGQKWWLSWLSRVKSWFASHVERLECIKRWDGLHLAIFGSAHVAQPSWAKLQQHYLHLRNIQPHSDSPHRFMIVRSFLHTEWISFCTCISHWISNTSSASSRVVSSLSDYAVWTCKDIIQECTMHQCPPQLSHLFYWTNGNILEVSVHDPHNAKAPCWVVFESPVRSGDLVPRGSNRDRDRLAFVPKPKIT